MYQRIVSVMESHARRLARHGALCLRPGYDLTDAIINDDRESQKLLEGAPYQVIGTGENAGNLCSSKDSDSGMCSF